MAEYAAIPNFGQFTEYVTQGEIVDGVYTVVINHVDMGQLPVVEAAETLKADYEKIEPLGRLPKLTTQEVESVGVKVKAVYHDDVVKEVTKTDNPITVTGTIVEVKSFPLWKAGLAVKLAEVYLLPDDKNLYKVIQPHTTQVDWKPTLTPALWLKYYTVDMGYQPWKQPLGAHDAYQKSVKVTHKSKLWENNIDNNIWEPGIYGWKDLGVYP